MDESPERRVTLATRPDLEGRLFAIRELKGEYYLGTVDAWNYLDRRSAIDAGPKKFAEEINKRANLTGKDYCATPARIAGIARILDNSRDEFEDTFGNIFQVDFEKIMEIENLDKEDLTTEEFENLRNYLKFLFVKKDIVTTLYDNFTEKLCSLDLDPDPQGENYREIGRNLHWFLFEGDYRSPELKRLFKIDQPIEAIEYDPTLVDRYYEQDQNKNLVGLLAEIFSSAKEENVRTDEEMGQHITNYISSAIVERKSLDSSLEDCVGEAQRHIIPPLITYDWKNELSLDSLNSDFSVQRTVAKIRFIPLGKIIERITTDKLEHKFEYQRKIIGRFLEDNDLEKYEELFPFLETMTKGLNRSIEEKRKSIKFHEDRKSPKIQYNHHEEAIKREENAIRGMALVRKLLIEDENFVRRMMHDPKKREEI